MNVSVDSLDPERFRAVTGRLLLERVLQGVEGALAAGFETVKVNAALLRGLDRAEFDRFVAWTERRHEHALCDWAKRKPLPPAGFP